MYNPPSLTCKYSDWFYLEQETGLVERFRCKSWSCPVHRQQTAWAWAVRVARAGPERMITLTNIPKDRPTAYLAFQHLVRDLRDREGLGFEYVRFFEVGARTGMYHYHLGQRGDFVPVRLLSSRAAANGLGKVVDIRACHGEGPGWYMAKYIAKGLETLPLGWRKVAASRGFWGPTVAPEPVEGTWVLVKGQGALKRLLGASGRPLGQSGLARTEDLL